MKVLFLVDTENYPDIFHSKITHHGGYIYPKNKELTYYWKYVTAFGKKNNLNYFWKNTYKSELNINDIDTTISGILTFTFDDEEEAFYFSLKFGEYIL